MNERIKELALQTFSFKYKTAPDELNPGHTINDVEKFAELIIRECAKYMYTNYPETRYKVNYMRKHLGDPNWNVSIGDE